MNCKTAESDLPLTQVEQTEDNEEPPPLFQSYSYTEPGTAVLWDFGATASYYRAPAGSVVFAIHWNIGRPPGVTQPEKLLAVTLVGGPFSVLKVHFAPDGSGDPLRAVRKRLNST